MNQEALIYCNFRQRSDNSYEFSNQETESKRRRFDLESLDSSRLIGRSLRPLLLIFGNNISFELLFDDKTLTFSLYFFFQENLSLSFSGIIRSKAFNYPQTKSLIYFDNHILFLNIRLFIFIQFSYFFELYPSSFKNFLKFFFSCYFGFFQLPQFIQQLFIIHFAKINLFIHLPMKFFKIMHFLTILFFPQTFLMLYQILEFVFFQKDILILNFASISFIFILPAIYQLYFNNFTYNQPVVKIDWIKNRLEFSAVAWPLVCCCCINLTMRRCAKLERIFFVATSFLIKTVTFMSELNINGRHFSVKDNMIVPGEADAILKEGMIFILFRYSILLQIKSHYLMFSLNRRTSSHPLAKFIRAVQMVNYMIRNKIHTDDLYVLAKNALEKNQKQRTESDIQIIERYMSRIQYSIKLKQKYGQKLFQEVCKTLYYKKIEANQVIININQEGNTFYIILKGKVSVNIYLPKSSLDSSSISESENQMDGQFHRQEVNILNPGETFGELALEMDSKTTATIISLTNCEFACMDKFQFQKILGSVNQKEIQDKMNYLKMLPFLKGWFDNDVKTLSYHFNLEKFGRGQEVFHQESLISTPVVYFVKSGMFELIKTVKLHEKPTNTDLDKYLKKDLNRKEIIICTMSDYEMFGTEPFQELPKRQFTVRALQQDSEAYKVLKSDLERRLWLVGSKQILLDLIQEKSFFRIERLNAVILQLGFQSKIEMDEEKKQSTRLKSLLIVSDEPEAVQESQFNGSFYRASKQFQIVVPKVSIKPSTMIFNFLEAQKTLQYIQECKNSNEQVIQKQKQKQTSGKQLILKGTHKNSNSYNLPRKSKFKPVINNGYVASKYHFVTDSLENFGGSQNQKLNIEESLQQFLELMENQYSDELVNWGGTEGTKESLEKKKKEFYDHLKKYADLNKLSQLDIYEAASKRIFIAFKAEMLEVEFQNIQLKEDALVKTMQLQFLVGKSDNQIRKEYFLKQLKKMQKRLNVLHLIRKGLLKCTTNQYVDDNGNIVNFKTEQSAEQEIFNFVDHGQKNTFKASAQKTSRSQKQQPLLQYSGNDPNLITEIVNHGKTKEEKLVIVDQMVSNINNLIEELKSKKNSVAQVVPIQSPKNNKLLKLLKAPTQPLLTSIIDKVNSTSIMFNDTILQETQKRKTRPSLLQTSNSLSQSNFSNHKQMNYHTSGKYNIRTRITSNNQGLSFNRLFQLK